MKHPGIRKRGNKYHWYIQQNNERYYGTADTLTDALKARINSTNTKTSKVTIQEVITQLITLRWGNQKGFNTLQSALSHIVQYFGSNTPITALNNTAVNAYINHCITSVTPATINRRLSVIKTLVKHARIMGYTDAVIELGILPEHNTRTLTITSEQYTQLLSHVDNQTLKDVIIILYETGMRLSELLNLNPNDINHYKGEYGMITIPISKNGKPRTIPMTKTVHEVLQRRSMTTTEFKLFPFTHKQIYSLWEKMKDTVDDIIDTEHFTPHTLRHSCITNLVTNGMPIAYVQRWAGHSSILTTSRYTHLNDTVLERYV